MTTALALVASALWGGGDFLGGTLSRRLRPVQVLGGSQALAAVVLLLVLCATGAVGDLGAWGGWLGWSVVAGLTWALGMGALYSALAAGTMGVVAPIASCGMVLPVAVALVGGERPSALQLLGAAVAAAGVIGSAGPDARSGTGRQRRAVLLALAAAVLFGVEIACVAQGSRASVPMTLLGMRSTTLLCVGALLLERSTRARHRGSLVRPAPRDLLPLLAVGVLDLAATAAYAAASRSGMVSVVAVLASLYPAVTVLLARQVHGERLTGVQQLGVLAVLAGAACIGVGGGSA